MILRKLKVGGFRAFRNEITVPAEGEFSEDLNVIYGPNETGKTTLILALARGLFDDHSTGGKGIKRERPWNTGLCPKITIEISANSEEYRIEKQFLEDEKSVLSTKDNGKYKNLEEGSSSNEFVRKLFQGESTRGTTGPDQWGIVRALWMRQGRDRFDEPDLADLSDQITSDPSGTLTLSDTEQKIVQLVKEEYEGIFKSNGDYRTHKDSEIHALREEIQELEEEISELQRKQKAANEKQERVEKINEEIESVEAEIRELEDENEKLEVDVEQYKKKKSILEDLKTELSQKEDEKDKLKKDLKEWEELEETISDLNSEIGTLRNTIQQKEQQIEDLDRDISSADEEIKKLSKRKKGLRKQKELLQLINEIEDLEQRKTELEDIIGKIDCIKENLQERRIPADSDIERAQDLSKKINQLQGELRSVGLTVRILAESDWDLTISGSDGEQELELEADEESEHDFPSRVEIEIPGSGTIEVSSGAGEVQELQEELDQLKENLNEFLDEFAVSSIEELQKWKSEADGYTNEIESLKDRRDDKFGSFESPKQLNEELSEKKTKHDRLCDELDVSGVPSDLPDQEEISDELEEISGELETSNGEIESLRESRETIREELGNNKADLSGKKATLNEKRDQQEELVDTYNSKEELSKSIDGLNETAGELEGQIGDLKDELPDEDEDPEALIEKNKQQISDHRSKIQNQRSERDQILGKIEEIQEEGISSKLNRLEEDIKNKQRQLQSLQSRARGLKLLHEILQHRQEELKREYIGPVEKRMNEYLSAITGDQNRRLKLDSDFKPTKLYPDQNVEPQDYNNLEEWALSAGTKEQLFLALRMAFAKELADEEKQPLILDDVLGNTDPERHEEIKGLLRQESDALQVFILTCRPELYRDFVEAREIDLEAIKSEFRR